MVIMQLLETLIKPTACVTGPLDHCQENHEILYVFFLLFIFYHYSYWQYVASLRASGFGWELMKAISL